MGLRKIDTLRELVASKLGDWAVSCNVDKNELTVELRPEHLLAAARLLRDDESLAFDNFIDACGVDYLHYGQAEWTTEEATSSGFSRGADRNKMTVIPRQGERFAVVYHLLSIQMNWRIRLKVFLPESNLRVDSVTEIWPGANWFEREVFDLYGILFDGHADLRRILTDYGFIGHPFRKDFPISGHVEMRYDAKAKRVIYEPVQIEPRVLVPKVIRQDNRYVEVESEESSNARTA